VQAVLSRDSIKEPAPREGQPGSYMERENLARDAKAERASGSNREAESIDPPERCGLPLSSDELPQHRPKERSSARDARNHECR
jgi:hypothetical protein